MKNHTILTVLAVLAAALAHPAQAEFTQTKGEVTHLNGVALPPIQTAAQARAETEKRLAAIRAAEAKTASASALDTRPSSLPSHPKDVFYTGKPYLEETGQYVFLFRHYDPELGRWTSADPSGFPDGANSRIYICNTPNYAFDFLGLARQLIGERIDIHVPDCTYWSRDMGDGGDWVSWYGTSSSPFSCLPQSARPQAAALAANFVLTQLGLTAVGPQVQEWIAYGGDVSWKIYRDEQSAKTVWDFEFQIDSLSAWKRSQGGLGDQISFTPNKASGVLTAIVPE